MKHNQGFTLVELMITIAIIAILASVGYSSYTRYVVRNAEAQVEARMQSLSMELERYRSSRLTYQGFVPKVIDQNNTESYQYQDGAKTVYTNDTNNKYIISVTDGDDASLANTARGDWRMFAEPDENAMAGIQYKYFLSSSGQKCRSKNSDFSSATTCSGAGVESW